MTPAEQRKRAGELARRVSDFANHLTRHGHDPALTDDLRQAAIHLSYACGNTRSDFRRRRLARADLCLKIIRQRIEGDYPHDAC